MPDQNQALLDLLLGKKTSPHLPLGQSGPYRMPLAPYLKEESPFFISPPTNEFAAPFETDPFVKEPFSQFGSDWPGPSPKPPRGWEDKFELYPQQSKPVEEWGT